MNNLPLLFEGKLSGSLIITFLFIFLGCKRALIYPNDGYVKLYTEDIFSGEKIPFASIVLDTCNYIYTYENGYSDTIKQDTGLYNYKFIAANYRDTVIKVRIKTNDQIVPILMTPIKSGEQVKPYAFNWCPNSLNLYPCNSFRLLFNERMDTSTFRSAITTFAKFNGLCQGSSILDSTAKHQIYWYGENILTIYIYTSDSIKCDTNYVHKYFYFTRINIDSSAKAFSGKNIKSFLINQ